MKIIGCDLQTLAMLDTETGEIVNLTLTHEGDHVRKFGRESNARSVIQQIYGRPSHGSRNMIGEMRT